MIQRAMENPKVAWAWNQEVIEVLGESAEESLGCGLEGQEQAREIASWNLADAIYFEDAPGVLTPERARTLVPALLEAAGDIPIELHSHTTTGLSESAVPIGPVPSATRQAHSATARLDVSTTRSPIRPRSSNSSAAASSHRRCFASSSSS